MKFVQYQDCKSPHQLPLARELVGRLGVENFRYVYRDRDQVERASMGWGMSVAEKSWMLWMEQGESWRDLVENCDVLLTGFREIELFERRAVRGVKTYYQCERWFKPLGIVRLFGLFDYPIPGWVRMFVPSYRKMAKRFVRWIQNDPNGRVLAIGPWAKKDMLRLGVPESKIIPWGYFVAPSDQKSNHHSRTLSSPSTLKVLWVGRMIRLKRVDTIIRAVCEVEREVEKRGRGGQRTIQLTLVGDGPEKPCLQRFATQTHTLSNSQTFKPSITFLPSQPIDKIRDIMREHDVFVFASNAIEGWGAVVSEALEEGMTIIGTYEAGSSATILSDEWLFHVGDWRRLSKLLARCVEMKVAGTLHGQGIGEWSAQKAAERLLELIA